MILYYFRKNRKKRKKNGRPEKFRVERDERFLSKVKNERNVSSEIFLLS